jgi:hypothetical protein
VSASGDTIGHVHLRCTETKVQRVATTWPVTGMKDPQACRDLDPDEELRSHDIGVL